MGSPSRYSVTPTITSRHSITPTITSRHSIAPTINSQHIFDEPPPSYNEAINQQSHAPPLRSPREPPVQALSDLNIAPSREPPRPRSDHSHHSHHSQSSGGSWQPAQLPTVDACLTHLKLLECFYRLREEVGSADGLFGIRNEQMPPDLEPEKRRELLSRICEKRWQIYVTRASLRFQSWWRIIQPQSKMLVEDDLKDKTYGRIARDSRPISFTPDDLPPLDILMVYHAFLLNPRNFFADCIRFGKMGLWATGMPWGAIAVSLRGRYSTYQPSVKAEQNFRQRTRHPWDNFDEPNTMKIRCPKCSGPIDAPWTTVDGKRTWASETPGEDGSGFADRGFSHHCQCGLQLTHEVLRTQRFKNDMRSLFTQHTPMPGTFLSKGGLPVTASENAPGSEGYPMTFPNRLIKSGLGKILAQVCSLRGTETGTLADVRDQFNAALKNGKMLRRAAGKKVEVGPPTASERFATRRMMSTYWDNSSIFNMDLVGAVIRQNSFTSKMHNIDWVHSPAAETTMQRLIIKYENYISILARHPGQVVVPTLDIDLAWHTHQLSPAAYQAYTLEKTNAFINHDDKIDENALSTSYEWTAKTYQEMFYRPYSECTCWYCEAMSPESDLLSPKLPKSATKPSKFSRLLRPSSSDSSPAPAPSMVHISGHNAIKSPPSALDIDSQIAAMVQASRLDRAYELACYRAEKAKMPVPLRSEPRLWWGYTLPPSDGGEPFRSDVCLSAGLFVSDPACEGRGGSCVAETGAATIGVAPDGMSLEASGGCVSGMPTGGRGTAVGACGACGNGGCGGSGSACGGASGYGCSSRGGRAAMSGLGGLSTVIFGGAGACGGGGGG